MLLRYKLAFQGWEVHLRFVGLTCVCEISALRVCPRRPATYRIHT